MRRCFILLVTAVGCAHPTVLTNPQVAWSALAPTDAQLVYHSEGGVHVADLKTHTSFLLGAPDMKLRDVTDDGHLVVEIDKQDTELVVLRDSKELGRVAIPREPNLIAISPDGKHIAGTWFNTKGEAPRTDIWIIDVDAMKLDSIQARSLEDADLMTWTADSAAIVIVDKEEHEAKPHPAAAKTRDVYEIGTGKLASRELAYGDLKFARYEENDRDNTPDECTKSDGTKIPGNYSRLLSGINDPDIPYSWGFLPDCSMYFIFRDTLYVVDNARNLSSLGPFNILDEAPIVFAGGTFAAAP